MISVQRRYAASDEAQLSKGICETVDTSLSDISMHVFRNGLRFVRL